MESDGRVRPTSANFEDHPDGSPMSVVIAAESTVEIALEGHEGYGLVEFTAGDVRARGQGISRVEDGVPGHAEVFGPKPAASVRRPLAKLCQWVREPAGRPGKP